MSIMPFRFGEKASARTSRRDALARRLICGLALVALVVFAPVANADIKTLCENGKVTWGTDNVPQVIYLLDGEVCTEADQHKCARHTNHRLGRQGLGAHTRCRRRRCRRHFHFDDSRGRRRRRCRRLYRPDTDHRGGDIHDYGRRWRPSRHGCWQRRQRFFICRWLGKHCRQRRRRWRLAERGEARRFRRRWIACICELHWR